MQGENAGDMSSGSFNSASRSGRAATLFAGPFMNGVLAIILFAASFMAGFPASVGAPEITAVTPGSAAEEHGLQAGDIVLDVDGIPGAVSAIPGFQFRVLQRGQTSSDATDSITISRDGKILTLPLSESLTQEKLLGGCRTASCSGDGDHSNSAGKPCLLRRY